MKVDIGLWLRRIIDIIYGILVILLLAFWGKPAVKVILTVMLILSPAASAARIAWSYFDKTSSKKLSVRFRRAAGFITIGVMMMLLLVRERTAIIIGIIIAAMIISIVLCVVAKLLEINREDS